MDEPSPPTPYREGKPLSEIIPPDRRAQRTAALVIASMIAGVALWVVGGFVLEQMRSHASSPPVRTVPIVPGYVAGRLPSSTLHGPGGTTVTFPPHTRSVVHVWLQGCQDCMPAFEAMGELATHGGLGADVPVVNVSYGEADAAYASRYGVSTNLVFDQGGASVVRPLGIGTFTTLVVDPDGSIIHRDRPDRAGYRQRVRAALGVPDVEPEPRRTVEDPAVEPLGGGGELDADSVLRVVASHRAGVRRRCWDAMPAPKPERVAVTVRLTIDTKGRVSRLSSTGDHRAVGECLERELATWVFPAPSSVTSVNIPFRFETQ